MLNTQISARKILVIGILCVVFMIFSVVLFIFLMSDPYRWSAPSDEELMQFFENHHDEFIVLAEMVINDRKKLSSLTKSNINGQVNTARAQEYQKLMSSFPKNITITVNHNSIVRFVFSRRGILAIGRGWMKGIQYMPERFERSSNLVESLNDLSGFPPNEYNEYFKRIEPTWYVLYVNFD